MKLTQARLKELLNYDEGQLIWKVKSGKMLPGRIAGTKTIKGYIQVRVDGRLYLAHRLIFLWHHGWMPPKVDHRDTNKENNRIKNLRPATTQQNGFNRGATRANTSGAKGVSFHKAAGKWAAQTIINRKHVHLGLFGTVEEAAAAYKSAAESMHGEFARAA